MSDSYFTVVSESSDVVRFAALEHTVGPWSPDLQHGGPPTALAVAMAERATRNATGRTDLSARRVAADFVGAVPVGEIEARSRTVRIARSAALIEVLLTSADRVCLDARVWLVREADTTGLMAATPAPPPVPDAGGTARGNLGLHFGYGDSIDWRYLRGAITSAGPAAVWARAPLPLAPGWEQSGLGQVALLADSASGISAELDWDEWSFANVDLDLHLARPVHGEWILLDAQTQLGGAGSALARSTISDRAGVVGAGLQTLVVAPRKR